MNIITNSAIPLLPPPLNSNSGAVSVANSKGKQPDSLSSGRTPLPSKVTISAAEYENLKNQAAIKDKQRAQQLPVLSKASHGTQRALSVYQQTLSASQDLAGGSLAGIDTFA